MPRITTNAPGAAAAGPYSHAAEHAGLVFLSGQTPLDPGTGALLEGEIEAQTRQGFTNLGAVLDAADLTFADVVKVNVFPDRHGRLRRDELGVRASSGCSDASASANRRSGSTLAISSLAAPPIRCRMPAGTVSALPEHLDLDLT